MHELVIRNGLLVDGSGAPARPADVVVDAGRITGVSSERRQELEAAIQKIAGAIAHLDTFNDERRKVRG